MDSGRHRNSFARLIETARFAFPLAREANRRLNTLQIAATLITAIVTPLLVVVLGAAVSQIELSVSLGRPDSRVLDRWVLLAGTVGLLMTTAEAARKYCRHRLSDEIRLRINQRVVSHAATLDLQLLELFQAEYEPCPTS